ncbi:MAG: dihydropteroate synthase [Nitrososphaera sp.]|nr:dihydropteroate synthase [Nitrososphaera sp.]
MAAIGSVVVGKDLVRVMGIINASPESFYRGSIRTDTQDIASAAKEMQRAGAQIVDIGAMSTAPYLETMVSVDEEVRRLKQAIKAVKDSCSLPVSVDTPRADVAKEAVKAGADAINDVTGLQYDSKMASVISEAKIAVILGAYSRQSASGRISGTIAALRQSLSAAKKAGIKQDKIIIDPSIGFFRSEGKNPFFTKMTDMPWYTRDIDILSNLGKLRKLGRPICVSASRKSFIGHLLGLQPEDRLAASLVCEAVAAINGASIIRTHNVRQTVQALTMLQLVR